MRARGRHRRTPQGRKRRARTHAAGGPRGGADVGGRDRGGAAQFLYGAVPARRTAEDQLEEARRTAKRKHDAEVEEQRVHNREIKGKVRKKFKAALAVTAAHDPIAERAKATAKAAIASVLATYKDKAV